MKVRARATVVDGIRFPSMMEARVYSRLRLLAKAEGATLFRQVRFPLFNLAPEEGSLLPHNISIDFVLVYPDGRRRYIDAKPQRRQAKSRDWKRGKAAFEMCYQASIEETDK